MTAGTDTQREAITLVTTYLRNQHIKYALDWDSSPTYVVIQLRDKCLTSDDHGDGAAFLVFRNGKIGYKCHHDRCQERKPAIVEELNRQRRTDADGSAQAGDQGWAEDTGTRLRLIDAATVTPERVEWLWGKRIPKAKITVLDGDPGVGKSAITAKLTAHITTGTPLPDDDQDGHPPGNVIIICAEDDPADTIVPRLIAMGADLTRVKILQMIETTRGERVFDVTQDLPLLEEAVADAKPALVIIDPIVAHVGAASPNKANEMRQALTPVGQFAARTGAAVLIVRHLNKQGGISALYRGSGSIDIVSIARSVLLVAEDKQGYRFLVRVKSNLAARPKALRFDLTGDEVLRVEWGELHDLDADDLLNGDTGTNSPEQEAILQVLRERAEAVRNGTSKDESMSPTEIQAELAIPGDGSALRRNLGKLKERGLVVQARYGRYRLPSSSTHTGHKRHGSNTSHSGHAQDHANVA